MTQQEPIKLLITGKTKNGGNSMKMKITGFADEIDQDLKIQVESIKKLGMSYIEMRGVDGNNLIFHSDEKVTEIKKYLDDNGISLSALGSPLGKIGIKDDFVKHFDEFKRAVEIAHMMETRNIRMFSFYLPEGCNPCDYENAVFDRLGQFVDYAASNDVVLLHENEKGIYGEKAKECKILMDTFYGDHFKAIFDFANFIQAGENTLEAYSLLKPYIVYIHVKDALLKDGSVVPAGMGDGNIAAILDDLNKSGYAGFLSLEPHLFDFVGLSELETSDKKTTIQKKEALTGFEAFQLAHESLMKIVNTLS